MGFMNKGVRTQHISSEKTGNCASHVHSCGDATQTICGWIQIICGWRNWSRVKHPVASDLPNLPDLCDHRRGVVYQNARYYSHPQHPKALTRLLNSHPTIDQTDSASRVFSQ